MKVVAAGFGILVLIGALGAYAQTLFPNTIPCRSGGLCAGAGMFMAPPFIQDDAGANILTDDTGAVKLQAQ